MRVAKHRWVLLVDNDVIINLFLRLEGAEQEIKLNFRFVLALILMRKRILKYHGTAIEDGAEYWSMRLVKEQDIHKVLNPRMDEERITRVSQELGAILHGDVGTLEEFRVPDADQPHACSGLEEQK